MSKKDYTELVIPLSDADMQGFRQLTKADTEDDLSQGILELIQQAIGKRKLGDYVHVEAHEKTVATKDREIARLKKELFETAGIWEQLVRAFHPEDGLQSTGKSMPAYVLERVSSLINSEKNQIATISNYEDRLQTLQETTIQRSEHEERVDTVSKEKAEIESRLTAESESVKRLNVTLTERDSEIKGLAEQIKSLECQRDEFETHMHNETDANNRLLQRVQLYRDTLRDWIAVVSANRRARGFFRKLFRVDTHINDTDREYAVRETDLVQQQIDEIVNPENDALTETDDSEDAHEPKQRTS